MKLNTNYEESNVAFYNRNVFGDETPHFYDCMCSDGFAIGVKSMYEANNLTIPRAIIIKYPSEKTINEDLSIIDYVLRVNHKSYTEELTYADVMIALGVVECGVIFP